MAFQGNAFQKDSFQTGIEVVPDDPIGQADMILLIPQDPPASYFQRRVFVPQEAAVVADAVLRRREMPPAAWWDEPPRPVMRRALSPGIPGMSVDNPPPLRRPDLAQWFRDPDPIIRAEQLSPGIPGQSVDNPPRWRPPDFSRWFTVPDAIVERRPLSPGVPGQSVDQPPPRRQDVSWAAFALPDTAPQLPKRLVPIAAAAADDPPYGVPSKSLSIIESAWVASLEFLPAQRGETTIREPDPPPGPPAMGIPYEVIDWPAQRARNLPQGAVVTADNPPFGIPSKQLTGILTQWQPEWYTVTALRPLNPAFEAVQVDNPPGLRPTLPMAVTVTWWEPPPPQRFPLPHQTVEFIPPPELPGIDDWIVRWRRRGRRG